MIVDARKLMIEQPAGSAVYFRSLSDIIGLPYSEIRFNTCHDWRWVDGLPRARKRVHPL